MKKSIQERIKLIFASHPGAKEFFFTADGQAFKTKEDAKTHARTLEDTAVSLVTRQDLAGGKVTLDSNPKAKDAAPSGPAGAKNEFQAKGAKGSSTDLGDEAREELARKYEMLSGKKAGNMKAETLTKKVAELESVAGGAAQAAANKNESETNKSE